MQGHKTPTCLPFTHRMNVHGYAVTILPRIVYVHKSDVAIHSCTPWCPQIWSCCHYAHSKCPAEWCCHQQSTVFAVFNQQSIHAHSYVHTYAAAIKDHQPLLWTTLYAWNGRPVKWCCHQGSPDFAIMSHQHCLHTQSLPCPTMMQWRSLIQCRHQGSPDHAKMSHQHYLHTLKAH